MNEEGFLGSWDLLRDTAKYIDQGWVEAEEKKALEEELGNNADTIVRNLADLAYSVIEFARTNEIETKEVLVTQQQTFPNVSTRQIARYLLEHINQYQSETSGDTENQEPTYQLTATNKGKMRITEVKYNLPKNIDSQDNLNEIFSIGTINTVIGLIETLKQSSRFESMLRVYSTRIEDSIPDYRPEIKKGIDINGMLVECASQSIAEDSGRIADIIMALRPPASTNWDSRQEYLRGWCEENAPKDDKDQGYSTRYQITGNKGAVRLNIRASYQCSIDEAFSMIYGMKQVSDGSTRRGISANDISFSDDIKIGFDGFVNCKEEFDRKVKAVNEKLSDKNEKPKFYSKVEGPVHPKYHTQDYDKVSLSLYYDGNKVNVNLEANLGIGHSHLQRIGLLERVSALERFMPLVQNQTTE